MRTFTRILAVMLACMLLAAVCPALAEETVTINFWHHYSAQSAENETLMNVLIPVFEAENPGIKVNAVSHEWAELHDKVLVSANSNALPDVARCDIAWLPEFQKMGILRHVHCRDRRPLLCPGSEHQQQDRVLQYRHAGSGGGESARHHG